jgi:hypothetical protein
MIYWYRSYIELSGHRPLWWVLCEAFLMWRVERRVGKVLNRGPRLDPSI